MNKLWRYWGLTSDFARFFSGIGSELDAGLEYDGRADSWIEDRGGDLAFLRAADELRSNVPLISLRAMNGAPGQSANSKMSQ